MSHCKFCREDLDQLPPEANVFRHTVGLCIPSRNDVDAAIQQLEIEEENEKEAIRAFWKREREQARKVPLRRARLLLVGLLCFIGSLVFAWYVLFPLAWRVNQWAGK